MVILAQLVVRKGYSKLKCMPGVISLMSAFFPPSEADESTVNTILSIHDPLFLLLLPHSRLPTPQCLFILLIYSAETAVPPSTAFPVGMTHTHTCTHTHTHIRNRAHVCLSMVLWQVYNSRRAASICTHIQFSSRRPHSRFQLLIFLSLPFSVSSSAYH